ncbi:MAG TPA: deoxyribonuclease IV [Actinomycetota bacterium]|nr:deoxyribonuclease IV [Actinomycetota bacterium]
MRIGMHVRGFDAGRPVAAARAIERGAEAVQIFASNPRQWRVPPVDPDVDAEFRRQIAGAGLGPLFIHAPYLVNLASPTQATRNASCRTVSWTMRRAAALGVEGVIIHAGHCVGRERAEALDCSAELVCNLLGDAPAGPRLLLELTSGAKGAVASHLAQAAELLAACGPHHNLGICLDTCHLHAAGYDLSGPDGVHQLTGEVDELVGLDRLALVHANDSRDLRGSRRDRHWHIGQGQIGLDGFRALVEHPALAGVPFICETPGELEDDRANVAVLQSLRDGRPVAPAAPRVERTDRPH